MARALESQCVVVQSPTVGNVDWCPAIDEKTEARQGLCALDGFWRKAAWSPRGNGRARLGQGRGRSGQGCRAGGDERVLPFLHWAESAGA